MAAAHTFFTRGLLPIALSSVLIFASAAGELVISVSDIVRGETATITLTGGLPKAQAALLYSFQGPGSDYVDKYDVASGLTGFVMLPMGRTDSSGSATAISKLDQNFGSGEIKTWVQVVQAGTASEVVERDIEGATPGYEVGCIYPSKMQPPSQARNAAVANASQTIVAQWKDIETPVVVYQAGMVTMCPWNCVAYHSGSALIARMDNDPRPPRFRVPEFGRNSWSSAMCLYQCIADLYKPDGAIPAGPAAYGQIREFIEGSGFAPESLDPRLRACWDQQDWPCVERFVAAHGFSPYVVGQVVALEIKDENRGRRAAWNADGQMRWDFMKNTSVPCTVNCQKFGDTTGYVPRNSPGRPVDAANKYTVEGVDRLWQPLQEITDGGFAFRQEHVTPHLTNVAPLALRTGWRSLPDPAYDYKLEADLVVSRAAETAASQSQKDAVEFFDNKLAVRRLIQLPFGPFFNPTYEQLVLFHIGIDAAEQDSLVQAWREKVRHDLVRPTTVIQRWGNDKLITYNGNQSSTGPAEIAARDFQPYIRVMPHAEYPSGSGCLCSSYAEFTDTFTNRVFGATMGDLGDVGYRKAPGVKPYGFDYCYDLKNGDKTCKPGFSVHANLSDAAHVCGVSRLWGGMHFTAAVPDAEALCKGIGIAADEETRVLPGTEDLTTGYREGDARPKCST